MCQRLVFMAVLLFMPVGVAWAETHKLVPPAAGAQTYAVREPVLRIQPGDIVESSSIFNDFYTAEGSSGYPG